jgi:DNA-binding response OmpR family regulator
MNDQIKVILVEDDQDLRESIVEYLTLSGLDVTGVGSGLEFYQTLAGGSFNIAIFDVGLPDQSGYTLAEYARQKTSMGIIIMTARGEAADRLQGYSSGADLYLVKPVDCRELAATIRNLYRRLSALTVQSPQTPPAHSWVLEKSTWRLVTPDRCVITLTAKEMQFISCLAAADGNTVSREHLLDKLGYGDDEYANRAMDSLVRRLRRKIEEQTSTTSPLKTVHTMGYCFTSPLAMA